MTDLNLLKAPYILPTRRNHALEHASLHILSRRFPKTGMGGHSNPTGFFIIGQIPTEQVRAAVSEALVRLQNGESGLAIHPGCGTNYAVTGGLAALSALFGFVGTRNTRERLERLPLVTLLATLSLMLGQALGPLLQQKITTDADPGDLAIVDIYPITPNLHRVVTR
jgi:hypothetical protein